jgi:hypothetical protein
MNRLVYWGIDAVWIEAIWMGVRLYSPSNIHSALTIRSEFEERWIS